MERPAHGRKCRAHVLLLAVCALAASSGNAQEKQLSLEPITSESQFLDLIDLEEDASKQLPLIDLFMQQFPKYRAMAAVYPLAQQDCVKLKLYDRALEFGDKLLQIDSGDIEAVKLNIEAAEGKKDEALIKKWKDRLALLQVEPDGEVTASSRILTPYVEGSEDGGSLAASMSPRQRSMRARLEALAFNQVIEEKSASARLHLLQQFSAQFPASQHAANVQYLSFLAHREMGEDAKALQIAEAMLTRDRTREDVLFFVAATYFGQKRNHEKVLSYSNAMVDLVNGKLRPEEVPEADWQKHKRSIILQANWMAGMVHLNAERFNAAESHLRTVLPMATSQEMALSVTNSLAFLNYKMRRIPEALRLYESLLKTPMQATAEQAIASIKSEYALQ